MLQARAAVFSLALVGALVVSANANADSHNGPQRYDGSIEGASRAAPRQAQWAWSKETKWLSYVTAAVSSGASSGRDVAEGLGRGLGLGEGAQRGRGGAAPAPLLGLTLLGQIGIAGGLFAAWRRRKAKGQQA